jgi:hypothetical protein
MALPAAETFATANNPLSGSSDWGVTGAASDSGDASSGRYISGNLGSSNDEAAYWVSDTFNDDQYSQIEYAVTNGGFYRVGIVLRAGSGNEGLLIRLLTNNGNFEAYRWTSGGSRSSLGSAFTPSATVGAGDIIRGEIEGTTLTLKVDYGSGFVTETTWDASAGPSSGSAGIYIVDYNSSVHISGDNWEGGNLGAAPTSIIPQIMHNRRIQQ